MKMQTSVDPMGSPVYGHVQVDVHGVPITAPNCDRENLKGLVGTGPITGWVTLPDGTRYNVTEPFVDVEPEHIGLVSCAVGRRYEAEGHPLHDEDTPFHHLCVADCGESRRSASDPGQAAAIADVVPKVAAIEDPEHRAEVAEAFGLTEHLAAFTAGAGTVVASSTSGEQL